MIKESNNRDRQYIKFAISHKKLLINCYLLRLYEVHWFITVGECSSVDILIRKSDFGTCSESYTVIHT